MSRWVAAVGLPDVRFAWLCRVGSQDGCDRVEVDEDGGPEGLEGRFALPEVATLAALIAVDDGSEQPLDPWSYAFEMVELGGIGERLKRGLAEIFPPADPYSAAPARCAARAASAIARLGW